MTTRTRSLILALIATLTLALVGAGCGGDDSGGGSSGDATERLEKAFETEVTNGDLALTFEATLDGVEDLDGPLKFTLEGPYAQDSPEDFPVLDWQITAEGAGQSFEAGVIATEDNAYVEYKGESYEVGTELFGQLKSQQEGRSSSITPQSLKALGVDPSGWLTDAEIEDGEEIGGDSTELVTGDVDVPAVIEDLLKVAQSPAVRQQLEAQGLSDPESDEPSDEDLQEIEDSIDKLSVEFNIDEDDVLRRTSVDADFTIPEGADVDSLEGGSVTLDFVLREVDVEPEIEPPANPRPIQELISQFSGGSGAAPQLR